MSIKIVTDSTCDLPASLITRYGINVIPLYIHVNNHDYLDGIDLTREEFYRRLPEYTPPPTTAIPAPDTFRQIYSKLAADGASEILSIHISISLSGTVDVARLVAKEFDKIPVTVLDSRQLSMGTGFLVKAAAEAAEECKSMPQILAILEEMIPRIHVCAALDTLEFMRRSGRVSIAAAGIGQLLRIKPLLKMYNGQASSEKIRTRRGALKRLSELLSSYAPIEQFAFVHSAAERVALFKSMVASLIPPGETIVTDINPVLGAHIGPQVIGFACVSTTK